MLEIFQDSLFSDFVESAVTYNMNRPVAWCANRYHNMTSQTPALLSLWT
jgi:hypothetical protein